MGRQKYSIEDALQLAEYRGGKCLSRTYDSRQRMLWRCADNHEWAARFYSVLSGSWCPHCSWHWNEEKCRFVFESILGKKFPRNRSVLCGYELDGYCDETKLAFEYQGVQHYKPVEMFGHKGVAASVKYESVVSRDLEKQKRCQKLGIRLYEIPYFCHKTDAELVNYVSGLLKQTVAVDWGRFYDGLSILKVLRKIAKLHGGTMISNYYYGHECPVEWRCGLGHEWKASPSSVKNNGTWCPYCAWNRQKTIDDVKRIASVRGGECLSVNYTNNTEQLLWKCNNGHIWQASYTSIVDRGSWCPYCSKRAKMTLEEMQRIAADKGGKCLSGTYINRYTNLLWECGEGHRWEAQPAHIKFDTWCPYCNPGSKKVMPTIEEMMSLANLKGGACLSDKYVNAHTKLGWRCKNGHEWEASPTNIKSGKWCRKCCIEARKRK